MATTSSPASIGHTLDPDTFAFGSGIVSAFQVGRFVTVRGGQSVGGTANPVSDQIEASTNDPQTASELADQQKEPRWKLGLVIAGCDARLNKEAVCGVGLVSASLCDGAGERRLPRQRQQTDAIRECTLLPGVPFTTRV